MACAHLIRGVITKRKTIFELEAKLHALRVPTLVMTGDQDEPCVEPALFNSISAEFLTAVENGRWGTWEA